jgi:DsbC/DsbD-like thiol-disulfide interchange protein
MSLFPSTTAKSEHVEISFVPGVEAVDKSEPFEIALRLKHADGWHTYWKNPGDAGKATEIEWVHVPKSWKISDIRWPAPQRFGNDAVGGYGYTGETLLMFTVTPSDEPGSKVESLIAKVKWLECADVCLPGEGKIDQRLAIKPAGKGGPNHDLDAARAKLPVAGPAATFAVTDRGVTLTSEAVAKDAYFFAETAGLVDAAKPQTVAGKTLTLPRAANAKLDGVTRLDGVLVSGGKAMQISAERETRK